jgi:hypothetical protein
MRNLNMRGALAVVAVSVGVLAGCGGGDDGGEATVGACIDSDSAVVSCDSSDATQTLVSDQSEPDAIACVEIGDKPQTQVTVDGKDFCAEPK